MVLVAVLAFFAVDLLIIEQRIGSAGSIASPMPPTSSWPTCSAKSCASSMPRRWRRRMSGVIASAAHAIAVLTADGEVLSTRLGALSLAEVFPAGRRSRR
jgi:hypothetical protein